MGGKISYQVNISHYLYPNDYNPLISTFSFNRYLLVKRHFWCISNMKVYVLLIDTFSYTTYINTYIYIYIYIYLELEFYKENSSTWIFHFIHFTNEYFLTLYHYYNLFLYVLVYIYIYIYNILSLAKLFRKKGARLSYQT